MSRKTGWEGPTTSPDWIDAEALMRAMSALHDGHVALIISPDGIGASGGLDVAASIIFTVVPGSNLPESLVRRGGWPCDTHSTLCAHVFSLLYDLDHKIGETYRQRSLLN